VDPQRRSPTRAERHQPRPVHLALAWAWPGAEPLAPGRRWRSCWSCAVAGVRVLLICHRRRRHATVISILNAYAGCRPWPWLRAQQQAPDHRGALDGSSGLILPSSCASHEPSFTNVLFGAFGQTQQAAAGRGQGLQVGHPESAAQIMARPTWCDRAGLRMAVARPAPVRSCTTSSRSAASPSSSPSTRWPAHAGHMNVLLAEARSLRRPGGDGRDQRDLPSGRGADHRRQRRGQPAAAPTRPAHICMPIIDADKAGPSRIKRQEPASPGSRTNSTTWTRPSCYSATPRSWWELASSWRRRRTLKTNAPPSSSG